MGSAPTHYRHPGWPEATPIVTLLDGGRLRLRPLKRRDFRAWSDLRMRDKEFLKPVEPTVPSSWSEAHSRLAWWDNVTYLLRAARKGTVVPMVIELDGRFVGQLTIGNIQHGGISDAWIGYWVSSAMTGRGIATAACALGVDHAFRRIGLHRLTATYLPSNPASGQVLKHSGFRPEGYLIRNLHIDGKWMDHHFVALLADEYPITAVERLTREGRLRR
ncbi:acetyl transferase [Corynebacterium suranareeae]|uniref:Acetyl transferase n=1 Tax=Corynebacterium suranareeae TaxID=2506452 RepID=A0A160PN15_9CORY|nr:GNAT family protein [Corynebacterium suranareeae]BAU95277.1 acetyl transferase [Corynebacterium suranareeae]